MRLTGGLGLILAAIGAWLCAPSPVFAQSAIAGVVKDTSGAVMPGVTVEAASPALIEKVRSVVSDDRGVYQIVGLAPGKYTVTFTLSGFSIVKREGVELPSNFTATVNADLRVGALEETVTVSGASPVVDVQSTAKTQVCQSADRFISHDSRMIENFLELARGGDTVPGRQVSLAAKINGIERKGEVLVRVSQFVGCGGR